MPALNGVARFFLGAVIAFLMPTLFGLAISALILTFDRDAGPLTGSGLTCTPEKEGRTASPNGRFIAISIRLACEDVSDPKNGDIRIFVTSTRLDRAAHIATIHNGKNEPIKISWSSNMTVNIPDQHDSTLKFAKEWCEIQPSLIVSNP